MELALNHPEEIEQYLKILYDFLTVVDDGFLGEEDRQVGQSIDISGVFGELVRLIKVGGLYQSYIRDADQEQGEELDDLPSFADLLNMVTFPIKEVEYNSGVTVISSRTFKIPPEQLPIEILEFKDDETFRQKAALLKIGDDDIEVVPECFKAYRLTKFLGKGSYGSVFAACWSNICNYAIKIIMLAGGDTSLGQVPAVFIREAKVIKRLSEMDVGPGFFDAWICKLPSGIIFGCLVIEIWDGELRRDDCLTPEQIDKLETQIRKIHALGEMHGDIFLKNILVKRSGGKVVDVTLNDFGTIGKVEQWRKILSESREDFFYNNYLESPQNQQLFEDKNVSFQDVLDDPRVLDYALVYYLRKKCL